MVRGPGDPAKIHGLLSERLQVSMDRGEVERAIDVLLEDLNERRLHELEAAKVHPS
jgi:hypothetical protein